MPRKGVEEEVAVVPGVRMEKKKQAFCLLWLFITCNECMELWGLFFEFNGRDWRYLLGRVVYDAS